jgi:hypothetical protein
MCLLNHFRFPGILGHFPREAVYAKRPGFPGKREGEILGSNALWNYVQHCIAARLSYILETASLAQTASCT